MNQFIDYLDLKPVPKSNINLDARMQSVFDRLKDMASKYKIEVITAKAPDIKSNHGVE
jgi:hypothetical protein